MTTITPLSTTSLQSFHSFGLDVHAKQIFCATSSDDILPLWQLSPQTPTLMLGEGSNVLFCEDFAGTVVLNRLKGIDVTQTDSHWLLHVASGENWHEFVSWTIANGMFGLENLALIPGVVGSAPIQNIGAYGRELQDFCDYVDVLFLASGETKRLSKAMLHFGYRDSIFKGALKDSVIITAVGFSLAKDWQPQISYGPLQQLAAELSASQQEITAEAIFQRVCQIRREKLPNPSEIGNAGSFFKNPVVSEEAANALLARFPNMPHYADEQGKVKLAAGWLIDKCGLKGKTLGGAAVHENQALVLVNKQNATAFDVINLAKLVVENVRQEFNVDLVPEVRLIAKTGEVSWESLCLCS